MTTETHSLSQRRPAVPFGQVQVLCGLQVAPCWQGGTQGMVTATGRERITISKGQRGVIPARARAAHWPVSQTSPTNPLAQRHLLKPTHTPPFLHGFWHWTSSEGSRCKTEMLDENIRLWFMLVVSAGSSATALLVFCKSAQMCYWCVPKSSFQWWSIGQMQVESVCSHLSGNEPPATHQHTCICWHRHIFPRSDRRECRELHKWTHKKVELCIKILFHHGKISKTDYKHWGSRNPVFEFTPPKVTHIADGV